MFGCIRKDTCLHTFRYHLLRLDTNNHLQIPTCYALMRIKRCNVMLVTAVYCQNTVTLAYTDATDIADKSSVSIRSIRNNLYLIRILP